MTTTTVSDAIILPQSQGTGLSGESAVIDAAINGVLNRYVGGEYVSSTYSTGLQFQNHDGANDTVEVGPGIVFVQDNSSSTSGERGSGGNPQAESSTTSGYDTELPEGHTYAVLLPTATQISVSDSTLNEVYVDLPDVTANNSVNLEHDGSTTVSPGNTSLKIGETNPDDASADIRANDDASPTYNSLTVNGTTTTDALNATERSTTNVTTAMTLSGSDLAVSSGNVVDIPFDTIKNEHPEIATADTSTGEITIQKSGQYLMFTHVGWDSNAGNWATGDLCRPAILVNGSVIIDEAERKNSDGDEVKEAIVYENLSVNDVVTVNVFQDSGNQQFAEAKPNRTNIAVIHFG